MSTQPMDRYVPEWTEADRLRRIRRDTKLTQAQFAERLGMKVERYSAWESGRNNPPAKDFVAAAKRIELAFGVPAEWTLGLDLPSPHNPHDPEGVSQPTVYSVATLDAHRVRPVALPAAA